MKIIIFFILTSCVFRSNAQVSDTIYWTSNYKLKWNDFRGAIPDSVNEYDAMTFTQIRYKIVPTEAGYNFSVDCFFLKSFSWSKAISNSLLFHEQRHFDIAEIFARKLRREFRNYKYSNWESLKADFKIMFAKIIKERDVYNKEYDAKTKHSKDKQIQKQWDQKIKNELFLLRKFS